MNEEDGTHVTRSKVATTSRVLYCAAQHHCRWYAATVSVTVADDPNYSLQGSIKSWPFLFLPLRNDGGIGFVHVHLKMSNDRKDPLTNNVSRPVKSHFLFGAQQDSFVSGLDGKLVNPNALVGSSLCRPSKIKKTKTSWDPLEYQCHESVLERPESRPKQNFPRQIWNFWYPSFGSTIF